MVADGQQGWDAREIECFLTLCEELHFGSTAARMHLTQARISQLLRCLERRVGTPLFDRTSRRVVPTEAGTRLREDIEAPYRSVGEVLERARERASRAAATLSIGFVGPLSDHLLRMTDEFRRGRYNIEFHELRLCDPFGPVLRGEIDAAFICAPVNDTALAVGPALIWDSIVVAVPHASELAPRQQIPAEELAGHAMVDIRPPAPDGWRRGWSPLRTPHGAPIPRGPSVSTLAEAFTAIAAGTGTMLFPSRTARLHQRHDVVFVPVQGLPASSISLVWNKQRHTHPVRELNAHCTPR